MNTPKLTNDEWIVTGHEVIAWISDLEFFDITHDPRIEKFVLRINHIATAATVFLGVTDSLSEAIGRARAHVNADNNEILSCTHGRTLVEPCADCDDKPIDKQRPADPLA